MDLSCSQKDQGCLKIKFKQILNECISKEKQHEPPYPNKGGQAGARPRLTQSSARPIRHCFLFLRFSSVISFRFFIDSFDFFIDSFEFSSIRSISLNTYVFI